MNTARVAGLFYMITFITGLVALVARVGRLAAVAGGVAGASYVVVTLLLYVLFKPVNRPLSLLAASISLAGIVVGPLRLTTMNPLVLFGFYCLLLGYLILRATFGSRMLAALMAFAGVGWLTFLYPPLARSLYPYNFAPGMIGEGALTVWLLASGATSARRLGRVHVNHQ